MSTWRTTTGVQRGRDGEHAANASLFAGLPTRYLPAWRVRLVKNSRRMQQRVRWFFRIRRGVMVNGFWYKETSAIPLGKALLAPPRGPGFKEYRITYPDGVKQLVRVSVTDVFADLMGSVGLDQYYKVADLIRPGSRVLEVGAGTGYRAAWLSSMVGPSGAVVAIGQKRELAEYAQRRYPRPNIAFEVGSPQTLAGETDGAFDTVFVSGVLDLSEESATLAQELWRVLAAGGRMVVHLASEPSAGAQGASGNATPKGGLGGEGAESPRRPSGEKGWGETEQKPTPLPAAVRAFERILAGSSISLPATGTMGRSAGRDAPKGIGDRPAGETGRPGAAPVMGGTGGKGNGGRPINAVVVSEPGPSVLLVVVKKPEMPL